MQKDIGNHIVYADGRVWSKYWNRFLKPGLGTRGYPQTNIDGKIKRIHRIVAEAFIPNPKNLLEVNHIDGNKLNNAVENLEWCTPKENVHHAHKNGLIKIKVGSDHHRSKLTEEQVKKIKYGHKDLLQKEIAIFYGIHKSVVCSIRKGKSWKHI